MRTFQYANREYTPSVDLNTLGQTFNTLEQGHKEAVKAASDLEITVSNLAMNEAEDGFKQQLLNEITNTIDENTIYGNSYAALDNLIRKAGNIASDGRVTGRLRSHAAKEKYDAKVDAMPITEGMKQMYKETNPYYYEEGEIDKRTGKYLPGKLWKPTTTPVATVSEAEIQRYALTVAAKDAGSSESVSFLDANGNPTSDPRKSEDGTIYKKTGTRWERLSASKLSQAYKMAIDSIPGAKESLHQDYTYARWNYDKQVNKAKETGGDITPVVEGFTDKNGNIYTEDQWLNNKIQGFTDVAAYSHSFNNVDYGPALANRKHRQQQAYAARQAGRAAVQQATQGILDILNGGKGANGAHIPFLVGTKEVEVNSFVGAEKTKGAANQKGLTTLFKYFPGFKRGGHTSISSVINWVHDRHFKGKGVGKGPNIVLNQLFKDAKAKGISISNEDKIHLINAFNGYVEANSQLKTLMKAAGKNADYLRFASNVVNQEYTNDNEYGRQIINNLNNYFKHNDEAKWQVGSQIMEGIARKYNTDINGLRKMGIDISLRDDKNYDVSIDAKHRMLIPKFASTIREVDKEIPGSIGGWLTNAFTKSVDKSNFHEYGIARGVGHGIMFSEQDIWTGISSIYNNGLEASRRANEKVGITTGTVSVHGITEGSFEAAWWEGNGRANGLTDSQIRTNKNEANKRLDNAFALGALSAADIQYVGKDNRMTKDVTKDQDAKLLIQHMYQKHPNDVSRSCIVPYGANPNQPLGYVIGLTVPKDAGETQFGKFKPGETYTFVVSGLVPEDNRYDPSTNPHILAENATTISRATGGSIENIGYNTYLGSTRITPKGDGSYRTAAFGNTKDLNEEEATSLSASINILRNIKYQYDAGVFNDNPIAQTQLINSLGQIVTSISSITNQNPNYINMMVYNYMKNNFEE